jgi:hypothetical protein
MRTLFLLIIAQTQCWLLGAQSQNNIRPQIIASLDQPFSHIVTAGPTSQALESLEMATGFYFSYNPDVLPKTVESDTWVNLSFRQGLDQMLGKNYAFRLRGNHIVIRTLQEGIINNGKQEYAITGYIKDNATGKAIPFASVYDTTTLKAALSSKDGYFELIVNDTHPITIGVTIPNEKDTFLVVSPLRRIETNLNRYILPQIQSLVPLANAAIDTLKSGTFWDRQIVGIHSLNQKIEHKLTKTPWNSEKWWKINEPIVQLGINYGSTWPWMPEMQLGIHQIYNRFIYAPGQYGNKMWGIGYGLGTQLGTKKGRGVAIEIMGMGLYPGHVEEIPLLATLSVMPQFRLGKRVKLSIGPEANTIFTHGIRAPREGYKLPPYQGLSATFDIQNGREMTAFFSWRVKLVIE